MLKIHHSLFVFLLGIFISTPFNFVFSQENLIENHSFEIGKINKGKPWNFFAGWHLRGRNGSLMIDLVTFDKAIKVDGFRSLRLESKNVTNKDKYIVFTQITSNKMELEPGATYELSVWAKAAMTDMKLKSKLDGWAKGIQYWHKSKVHTINTQWGKYSFTVTIPAKGSPDYNSKRKFCIILESNEAHGYIWLDNVSFKKIKSTPVIKDNLQKRETSFSYTPSNIIGDVHVWMDDMHYIRASWKGVNLFLRWGEIFTPLTWMQKKKSRSYYQFIPENAEIKAYLIPNVAVKIENKKGGVDYLWSYAYNQEDFTEAHKRLKVIPDFTTSPHMRADVKQTNHMEIRSDRITLISHIEFSKPPKEDVIFYPVLFPGGGKNRRYYNEVRILGEECFVTNKNGKTALFKYPLKVDSKIWLKDEPRSLFWTLKGLGNIKYQFSASDPDISILFYSNTGWPTTTNKFYASPAIVAKIVIPAKTKFKKGHYSCTLKTEVLFGNKSIIAKNSMPNISGDEIKKPTLDVQALAIGGAFKITEPLVFNAFLNGFRSKKKQKFTLSSQVVDYYNKNIIKKETQISFPSDITKAVSMKFPFLQPGAYILNVELKDKNGRKIDFCSVRFCIIKKPIEYPPEKSFFGCMNAFLRYAPSENSLQWDLFAEKAKNGLELMYNLGMKKIRWNDDHSINWPKIEPQKGKLRFPTITKSLLMARRAGMAIYIANGSFSPHASVHRFCPEWAKSGDKIVPISLRLSVPDKKKRSIFDIKADQDMPRNLKEYENYCYEVAMHFKEQACVFEIENETDLVNMENPKIEKAYIKNRVMLLVAAYRGIKRANPKNMVLAGTVSGIEKGEFRYLEKLFKYAKSKNLVFCDIIGPHYLLRDSQSPESKIYRLQAAQTLARHYKVSLWDGEEGFHGSMYDIKSIFPNAKFLKQEKNYAAKFIRVYLLAKYFGVEHINQCFALGNQALPLVGIPRWESDSGVVERFFGRDGFVKPYAVAHAALAQILEGAQAIERIKWGSEDIWVLVFKQNKNYFAAIWSSNSRATVDLDLPKKTIYRSILGAQKEIAGKQSLQISQEPFFLQLDNKTLLKALKKENLMPNKIIGITSFDFSDDQKKIQIELENFCSKKILIDSVEIKIGSEKIFKKNITILARKTILVTVPLKNITAKSSLVKILIKSGLKEYQKEKYLFSRTLQTARKEGWIIAIKAKEKPVIDGNLNEWGAAVPIELKFRKQIQYSYSVVDLDRWSGIKDLSATAYIMWDEINFYFACKVIDNAYMNRHKKGTARATWDSDSIQMVFDPLMDNSSVEGYNDDDQRIHLALTNQGEVHSSTLFGYENIKRLVRSNTGKIPGSKLVIKKTPDGLIYEFSMPNKELYPLDIKKSSTARFNFIVNDDDGNGRLKWIGITPGIGDRRAPYLYKQLYFSE